MDPTTKWLLRGACLVVIGGAFIVALSIYLDYCESKYISCPAPFAPTKPVPDIFCEPTSDQISRCSKDGKDWSECLKKAQEKCSSSR